jgi:hypothetical protein
MLDSALLKIDRAMKHINELNELLKESRPFTYVLETDIYRGLRATYAKRNEPIIGHVAAITADAIHNLRSALDHSYWEIVHVVATTEREARKIQFPFSETAAKLDEAVKNRLADRVSTAFFQTLIDLRPHGEEGGNELLYIIHSVDIIDRHRLPIPAVDYTRISSDIIRQQFPDFPLAFREFHFSMNPRDFVWKISPAGIDRTQIGIIRPPTTTLFEKELNVPVDIVLEVGPPLEKQPVVPLLHKLVDVTRTTIKSIRDAAP